MSSASDLKSIIAHAKEYGFVYPSSELYDGLQAVYDFGPNGVELRNNLRKYWWLSMVRMHENIVGLDAAIFMHPRTWEASGHVANFHDPMIDNKDSQKRYRVDTLIEDHAQRLRVEGRSAEADQVIKEMERCLEADDLQGLALMIQQFKISCPVSGTCNWTPIRQFNLMFSTEVGALSQEAGKLYLRPETAQGIFVNFLNVQKTSRMKIPFGIAQTGKAFRNEIVARQFIMRMREFEQMEMQFFVRPGTEMEWFAYWKETRMKWHQGLGIPAENLRFHDHAKLAHYANAATDIEYKFPFGFKEVEGVHSRTDYDLSRHQEFSGKKVQYFDPEVNKNYIPYVVETSIGLDRLFLVQLCHALQEEKWTTEDGREDSRTVLKVHPAIAPVKAAILPLTKKDGLPEKARDILKNLPLEFNVFYEEKDSIGKRYRRQDAIGTPFCVTVDHQTLEDNTVTVRHRDSMKQDRVSVSSLGALLQEACGWQALLA